jgi:uncharacterized phage protein (TIGR02216 family)
LKAAGASGGARHDVRPFPWPEIIRFGLSRLRLDPDTFWRLTPRELGLLAGQDRPDAMSAPDPAALAALIERFPDEKETNRWTMQRSA